MSRRKTLTLVCLCAGLDLLCLVSRDFCLDTQGLFWLVLSDWCLYRLFNLPAGKKGRKRVRE